MFDIVGKRRWFFAFSLLITIPGLIFILLTPITNGAVGLKFSIDYTGGTEWSIRFQDPNVTAEQVRNELVALGQDDATVTRTGHGFLDIRMSKVKCDSGVQCLAGHWNPNPRGKVSLYVLAEFEAQDQKLTGPSSASESCEARRI